MGNVLIDFEEYMFLARRGGTESKMRDEAEMKKDEDIRASVVQEVSSNSSCLIIFSS